MSRLTPCNYCWIFDLRREARDEGAQVFTKPDATHGGFDLFYVKSGEALNELASADNPQYQGWAPEISDRCACD